MPGPGTGHRAALVLASLDVLHRQRFGPVAPVRIANQNRHRGADRLRVAYTGDNLGAIRLDLHPSAAAEALLAPPKLAVNGFQRYRYSRGKSSEGRHQALAVGLSSGLKS